MTLIVELKNELRKVEQTRKEFETKVRVESPFQTTPKARSATTVQPTVAETNTAVS
jgi:hypothetical protein